MHRFLGIVRYEFRMSARRWSFWLAYGLLFIFFAANSASLTSGEQAAQFNGMLPGDLRPFVGLLAFQMNLFLPLVAGVLLADRMVRDYRLGVDELLTSTPLTRRAYILGKYTGGLLSVLTPTALILATFGILAAIGGAPLSFFPTLVLAFLVINVPAFAFITIFSLGFPLVIPVRVYQVLFIGYWFWGNFLNPRVFPTLAGTLLTPGGKIALDAFFGGLAAMGGEQSYTPLEGYLNLAVLAACILVAMLILDRYLAWRAQRM